MKKLTNFTRRLSLSLLALFLVPLTIPRAAQAQTTKTYYVNPIQLRGLQNYIGKSLTVYYATGSRGSLSMQDDQITIREVKDKRTYKIESDIINLPEINLKRANTWITYNIIVFVIHESNTFTWINGNRTLPEGQTMSGNTQFIDVHSLNKIEFDSLKEAQNAEQGTAIKYTFGVGIE